MNRSDILSSRIPFLKSISWDTVVSFNQALCSRKSNVVFGLNKESIDKVRDAWDKAQNTEMSVLELLQFQLKCHRNAPFLNFNGNVFAEITRKLLRSALIGMAENRMEAAESLAAHYVAGVIDQETALGGIRSLLDMEELQSGDHVATLKKSITGTVVRILNNKRIVWLPDGSKIELISEASTLIKL